MSRRPRFEELVALFAGPLLDEPDLDRTGASSEGTWQVLADERSTGGPAEDPAADSGREDGAAAAGEAKWTC